MGRFRKFAAALPAFVRARGGILLVVLAALLASSACAIRGTSCGHDFDFHLTSWLETQRSWSQGVLYPHWAQTPNWGAGEARFVFYPPVTWMLGALLAYPIAWSWVPAVFTFLCFAGAGLSTRALARQFLPAPAATLAGVIAPCAPYALFTAYERAAYGELAAAALIPLLLLLELKTRVGSTRANVFEGMLSGVKDGEGKSWSERHVKSLSELTGKIDEAERRYDELGQSNIVSADRVKELLQGWGDKANRPELEEREHAGASKIACELFYRKAARLPEGSEVQLVTGPVAAGKTTLIGDERDLTYEVDLSGKEEAFEHLDRLLGMGLRPEVDYVYTTPGLSAKRRAIRAELDGRTVRIDRSTAQHLDLPHSIQAIAEHFGDRVAINLYDTSVHPARSVPVTELGRLAYTGTQEDLLEQQQRHLDFLLDSGAISSELHQQISRRAPETCGRESETRIGPAEQSRGAEGRGEGGSRIEPAGTNPLTPNSHSIIPLSLVLAAIWLTNAPAGVMASYLLAYAALAAALIERRWWPVVRAAIAAPIGLGLAAFYLVPAAWEQRWVAIEQAVDIGMRIGDSWLFARHASPDLEYHDQVLRLASAIFVATALMALAAFAVSLLRRMLPRASRAVWMPLALLIPGLFLLQLPLSAPVWRTLPKLEFLQFPWRWLMVLGAPLAIFLAAATPLGNRRSRAWSALAWTVLLLAGTALASLTFFQFCDDWEQIDNQVAAFRANTGGEGTDEYAPAGSDNTTLASGLPDACLVSDPFQDLGESESGSAPVWYPEQGSCDQTYTAEVWQNERKRLQIESDHDGFLVLRLMRYPAWQIRVNGELVAPATNRQDGLIAIPVAAGSSTVEISWGTTPDVLWGRAISLVALILLAVLWGLEQRFANRRRSAIHLSSNECS